MALVLLRSFESAIDAALARSFLESEGITTFLFDEVTNPRFSVPVRLMVVDEDRDEALRLLRGAHANGAKAGQGGV